MAGNGVTCIGPRMTVLDMVNRYRATEAGFRALDTQASEFICCQALFDTLEQVADKYGLTLEQLMADLSTASTD